MPLLFQNKASATNQTVSTSPFIQAKLEANETTGSTMAEGEQDCKGWESDPQSFCIKVGKTYMTTEQGINPAVTSVDASDDGGCHVNFEDGTQLTVQRLEDHTVTVYISPGSKSKLPIKSATYSYKCLITGELQLTKIK
jgi:hypothetical protein